ncbi:MAG: hypothetical protein ACKO23_02935 [Gemmataceae bacterium]
MRKPRYHIIEFSRDLKIELERGPGRYLESVLLRKGTRRRALVRPQVIDIDGHLWEVADLFFDNGTITRTIPFAAICFVEASETWSPEP